MELIDKKDAIAAVRWGITYATKVSPDGSIEHVFEKENEALEKAAERIEKIQPQKSCPECGASMEG